MNIKDLTNYFLFQVGYHEKASNKDLYTDKNNGNKNFNKYADMIKNTTLLNGNKQAVEWCAVFVITCFYMVFGEDQTKKILNLPNKSSAAGCSYFYEYLKHNMNKEPSEGDIIFFGDKKPKHVGYIYKVDSNKIYTIEGNSDNQVKKHTYNKDSKKIFAWCTPLYVGNTGYIESNNSYTFKPKEENTYKVIAISGLRVRKEPNTNCEVLKVLKFGTKVKAEKFNDNWLVYNEGFISSKWVEKVK